MLGQIKYLFDVFNKYDILCLIQQVFCVTLAVVLVQLPVMFELVYHQEVQEVLLTRMQEQEVVAGNHWKKREVMQEDQVYFPLF